MPCIKSASSHTPKYPVASDTSSGRVNRTSVWSEEFHLCSQAETGPNSKATRPKGLHSAILFDHRPCTCRSEAERTLTDHARLLQIGDLLGREAEQTGEHLLVMLAEERRRRPVPALRTA